MNSLPQPNRERPDRNKPAFRSFRALAACLVVSLLSGCGGGRDARQTAGPPPRRGEAASASNLADDFSLRLSMTVLGNLRRAPRLVRMREEGIVRFLLPPASRPFQYVERPGEPPRGFNVDLAREIARLLNAKPNVALAGDAPEDYRPDIALSFAPSQIPGDVCADGRPAIFYFYRKEPPNWLRLCDAQRPDGPLPLALGDILDHLNETGVFREIYLAHFASPEDGPLQ